MTIATDDKLLNQSELARALGRTRQQISLEAKRRGFPSIATEQGKRFKLRDVQAYRRQQIRQRKPELAAPINTRPAQVADSAPVHLMQWMAELVPLAHLLDDRPPHRIKSWLGANLFAQQTVDDLQCLAHHLSFSVALAMNDIAVADGSAEMLTLAPREYFDELFSRLDPEDCARAMDASRLIWAGRRFFGTGPWWTRLAEPNEEPPTDIVNCEPLQHRKTSNIPASK